MCKDRPISSNIGPVYWGRTPKPPTRFGNNFFYTGGRIPQTPSIFRGLHPLKTPAHSKLFAISPPPPPKGDPLG